MDGHTIGSVTLIAAALLLLGTGGFSMLNIGLSRAHASATLCVASLGIFAVSMIFYHFIGFYLMYGDTGDEFFGLAMAAFTSAIILGALTERVKVVPCLVFTAIFSAFIFPAVGGWAWGGNWLESIGFHDFSGSSVIHITAGAAAAAGSHVMGPRAGRYAPDGRAIPFSGSNIPLATLGAFLISVGWIGLVTGQKFFDTSPALTNTLLGGAGGVLAGIVYVTWRYNKPDTTIIINCLIAGLVSVSAGADLFYPIFAVIVGMVGGVLTAYTIPLLDKRRFDDPIGVTPVHLVCGVWGTLAVVLTGHVVGQLIGLAMILIFSIGASMGTWLAIKRTIGLRCTARAERHGLDMEAVGLEAYPDFPIRTAGRPDITQIDRY